MPAKKILVAFIIFVLAFGAGFGTAHLIAKAGTARQFEQYEARLADLADLNKGLQDRNLELVKSNNFLGETNSRLADRLRDSEVRIGKAKKIVDGIAIGLDKDGEIIQRIIDTLSRVTDLVSIFAE